MANASYVSNASYGTGSSTVPKLSSAARRSISPPVQRVNASIDASALAAGNYDTGLGAIPAGAIIVDAIVDGVSVTSGGAPTFTLGWAATAGAAITGGNLTAALSMAAINATSVTSAVVTPKVPAATRFVTLTTAVAATTGGTIHVSLLYTPQML